MAISTLLFFSLTLSAPSTPAETITFATDVAPVLTKAGCNSGACHGAASGRGGFHLSLYGSRPASDYDEIVREFRGRRLNLQSPRKSLFVRKPTLDLEHEGGLRLDDDGREIVLAWIAGGAKFGQARALKQLVITPKQTNRNVGDEISLQAFAEFTDGERVDVTRWTTFSPVDKDGIVVRGEPPRAIIRRSGRQILIARYLSHTAAIEILAPFGEKKIDLSSLPRKNFIDDKVYARLEALRLPVSPTCDDATFHRRVRLDLTGRLPTPSEASSFENDPSENKREKLVDELLASKAFTTYWTYRLARILRLQVPGEDLPAAEKYHHWLNQQLMNERGWDEIASELIMTVGDSHELGQVTFHRTVRGAREEAEQVSETLLGVRLRCANCHDHPLDRWKQNDYHGLAAIFADLERGRVVRSVSGASVVHPYTGDAAESRLPGASSALNTTVLSPSAQRAALSHWLMNDENSTFAPAFVNRVWSVCFGRGLVEPVDDFRTTNPATHPELLRQLTKEFKSNDYRLRPLLKLICNSAAYARSVRPLTGNEHDSMFYSHAAVRPLTAEVLADAIADVTASPQSYAQQPQGTRAIELVDPLTPSRALDALGRCLPDACETESGSSAGLATMLHLMNGPLLNEKIAHPKGFLNQALASGDTNAEIVAACYLRAFGRTPTTAEEKFWQTKIPEDLSETSRRSTFEDLFWSLLISREFNTNH